jgi:hypothetical protein
MVSISIKIELSQSQPIRDILLFSFPLLQFIYLQWPKYTTTSPKSHRIKTRVRKSQLNRKSLKRGRNKNKRQEISLSEKDERLSVSTKG